VSLPEQHLLPLRLLQDTFHSAGLCSGQLAAEAFPVRECAGSKTQTKKLFNKRLVRDTGSSPISLTLMRRWWPRKPHTCSNRQQHTLATEHQCHQQVLSVQS
jgi:hypothetical protein